jgi:hypothetical protein
MPDRFAAISGGIALILPHRSPWLRLHEAIATDRMPP